MKDTLKRLNWPNVIIALSLIAIGVGIYLVFHKKPDDTPSKPIGSSMQQQKKAENNDTNKPEQKQPTATQPTPAPAPATTPATPAPKPTTQPGKLANSGPGETIAMFAAATAIGAALHHTTLRRRAYASK